MAHIVRKEGLVKELGKLRERFAWTEPVYCVCVGTDRSTGDSFGPLVGSLLQAAGYPHVIGTLDRPCDSVTLTARLTEVPQGAPVLAIDCVVGQSVGFFQLSPHPLEPGKSLGKPLPKVGGASLLGIVCLNRANPYTALQSASLHQVLRMAADASNAILEAFGTADSAQSAPAGTGRSSSAYTDRQELSKIEPFREAPFERLRGRAPIQWKSFVCFLTLYGIRTKKE